MCKDRQLDHTQFSPLHSPDKNKKIRDYRKERENDKSNKILYGEVWRRSEEEFEYLKKMLEETKNKNNMEINNDPSSSSGKHIILPESSNIKLSASAIPFIPTLPLQTTDQEIVTPPITSQAVPDSDNILHNNNSSHSKKNSQELVTPPNNNNESRTPPRNNDKGGLTHTHIHTPKTSISTNSSTILSSNALISKDSPRTLVLSSKV
eukprot:GHVR01150716.1.p1 GENE.GHVR01150716.1~~GHVR01150716.1.p1  ORF type:complete len:207 (-),score=33.69 GHVR01150716.1:91-711(-)